MTTVEPEQEDDDDDDDDEGDLSKYNLDDEVLVKKRKIISIIFLVEICKLVFNV